MSIIFNRAWAMPSLNTTSIEPIKSFVDRYLSVSKISVDPFARNSNLATYTNDLNPDTSADYHLDATLFLKHLALDNVKADLVIFDPPFSPRQISECYKNIGLSPNQKTTSATFYSEPKNAILDVITDNAIVLSFGWNSNGMGLKRGFEIIEILLVAHGGSHNDTICTAEKRTNYQTTLKL